MKFAIPGQTRTFVFTFTDRYGTKVDPDTGTKKAEVYDSEGALVETIPDGSFYPTGTGVFEVYYTVAEAAKAGRWEIIGSGIRGTAVARDRQTFKVVEWHVPEVDEIRQVLSNLSEQLVPTPAIDSAINAAYVKVANNTSAQASQDLKEEATLAWAVFLTYKEYVAVLNRGVGVTAGQISQLENYRLVAEELLEYARRGIPGAIAPSVAQPDDLITQYEEGNLDEEVV